MEESTEKLTLGKITIENCIFQLIFQINFKSPYLENYSVKFGNILPELLVRDVNTIFSVNSQIWRVLNFNGKGRSTLKTI